MVLLSQHRAALSRAARRLLGTPLNTLLSLLVIGIALTLPGVGYVLLDKASELGRNASGVQQISLFMALDAGKQEISEIENRLKREVKGKWRFVSRDAALKRLKEVDGMSEIVASLPRNPLPDAFIVEPDDATPASLEALRDSMKTWPKIAHIQLDSAWVKRFDAFLRLGKLALSLLAALFGAGLIAVTFNTIRLQVLALASEIEVSRLIGATDAFIRRPFYYFGALQGALGGLVSALIASLILHLLNQPVSELAALYGGEFSLAAMSAPQILILATSGALLGWLGAQLSVSLSLRQFD